VKIKVERSGGFAGISSTNELNVDKLPFLLEGTVRELLNTKRTKALTLPKNAVDYFRYKITIQDGNNDNVIECIDTQMNDSLKSLVSYVQKNSMKM